ncbi:MAG: tRNA pseudouridine(38-40) synthase TruA [Hyphomicrobium sp.]|nr:MAG: tRNA pseudouridine(38-40) synthase TruA [Hyphomicrobium sp.]
MPRYRITIEYNGAAFVGWQEQAAGTAVQTALESAIMRFSGEHARVRGAGRTDAGVHALGQVAHFDLARDWEPFRIQSAINFHLKPQAVGVVDCARTDDTFDARFSATARHYLYRIASRRTPLVLDRGRAWWVIAPLDATAMAEAASVLVGHHDFTTFRAQACQAKSPMRTLDRLDVTEVDTDAGHEIHIRASARSFLHNQVRSMVGSLKAVGEGKWTRADLVSALAARERTACGPVAPACGLYLVRVDYAATTATASAEMVGKFNAADDVE